jgi:hypothetical protein
MLENFAPAIAEVKTPTWILWGRNDAIASLRTARVLALRLPVVRLQVLESSGHDPMSSQPAAVSSFLLDGLSALPVPRARRPRPPLSADARPGRCEGKNGMLFQGDYTEIEISGCQDVQLDGVRSGAIRIRDSAVTMHDTHVATTAVALDVKRSRVEITASDLVGEVALESSGGDLDLAGVTLQGKAKSVHIGSSTRLIFSISRVDSPVSHRFVHELLELGSGAEL